MAPAELRQRKPDAAAAPAAPKKEEDDDKNKFIRHPAQEPDLEPNIFVMTGVFVVFVFVLGSVLFYKIDRQANGDFAQWIDDKFPAVQKVLERGADLIPVPNVFLGAQAAEFAPSIKLTEEELRAFDGTDPEQPIYLAINGTIYDVSISPSFYGPGGHYHHFVGKDATRAWVSECWDTPEQLTWRMDGVEEMFLPKYLDETLEDLHQGKWNPDEEEGDIGFGAVLPKAAMQMMAKKSMERFGTVTDGEKARRREADAVEAAQGVQQALDKWVKFFSTSEKYKAVGEVIFDESAPQPPALCAAAIQKRPIKGGKLQGLMDGQMNLGKVTEEAAQAAGAGGDDGFPAGMPESVKEQIRKSRAAAKEATEGGDATKDKVAHDDL